MSLNNIGDIRAAQGDAAGALAAYEESKAIRERLARSDPSNAGWQTDLVVSLVKLSGGGLTTPEVARAYLQRALEITARLEQEGRLTADQQGWKADLQRRLDGLNGE